MTSTVVNNLVFRAFVEKQKLTTPNFIDWYCNLRIVLSVKDKLTYLEHPIPAVPVPAPRKVFHPDVLAAHTTWVKASKEIAEHELLQTVREFHAYKHEEGQPIVNELHAMLKLHEQTLPKEDVAYALHAIGAGRIQKNNHKNKKPHLAAKGNNQGKGKTKLSYVPNTKILPPPKKDNPTKDAICHQCGEVGHWKRNCPQYLSELMKKKKLSQGASTSCIFTIELYSFPSKS
ncbi:zinc finger, CCHC-type containing protein [Tanacetum coccineum]